MNARLVIQTGTERPDIRKSPLDEMRLRSLQPMPRTKAKYRTRMNIVNWGEFH